MTTATIPVSRYDNRALKAAPQCESGHVCNLCGAAEGEVRIIKYTHLADRDDYVDVCEHCFCPGCHFRAECLTPVTQGMIEQAQADTGQCLLLAAR